MGTLNMAYDFFTSKEIKPEGYIKRLLRIQADGLSGNLDKIWPDVAESQWIGGNCEGWERVPYWLDGFIPLAYLLDDEDLKIRAQKYIDSIIARQEEDGWICPCEKDKRPEYDMWAAFLIAKVFTVYADATGDERVVDVLEGILFNLYEHIKEYKIFGWAKFRWYEALISIAWLYERRPSEKLIELAVMLKEQGTDFDELFSSEDIKTPKKNWTFEHHVVNIAMALKSGALYNALTSNGNADTAERMLNVLDGYHSMANGHFTGDECLAGDSPIQGTELCGVVEAMYSYEWLFAISGDFSWLDRLESLAYNALPATISPDMWTHQYDQMTNQISCIRMWGKPIFNTNNGEAHIFGLEPNFGCCTANFNQGFPKFVLSSFYKSDKEIVSASLMPSRLTTKIDGVDVEILLETDYPFKGELKYTVKASAPVKFTLKVRVPEFARDEYGKDFISFEREWQGTTEETVEFDFEPVFIKRPRDMVCLKYGPLLFSVAIEEKWIMHEYESKGILRKFPYCDYEIYPMSEFNYAFFGANFDIRENEIPELPFSSEKPAIEIFADMVKIDWGYEEGYPDICRKEPLSRKAISGVERVRLIPYGCTTLRLTETVFAE